MTTHTIFLCDFCGEPANFRFGKEPTETSPEKIEAADFCHGCYNQMYGKTGSLGPVQIKDLALKLLKKRSMN